MTHKLIKKLAAEVGEQFATNQSRLSFDAYLDLVEASPKSHLRNSAQYLRDCFLYFGRKDDGAFKLFDLPFSEDAQSLIGQISAQKKVFSLLQGFVKSGSVNKLLLLHGPNGSAKSTFVDTMMAALEAYSQTDEGAIYRFNWVFPLERITAHSSIGFGTDSAVDPLTLESFAHLKDDQINAKVQSDLDDHPLLLLPLKVRKKLIEKLLETHSDFVLSDYLSKGDLSHTGRQIFDALFSDYEGDIETLLKHIQVERFYISRRYRQGAVTVEPQMRVDAGIRQLTADRSLSALPTSLQNQTLFEPFGDLVDANRGVIQYEDFLKRHPDLNKYLLSTAEKATVALDSRILHLDSIFLASANEDYLDAFKQTADYTSFKGRVEFVRFPYLLSYLDEAKIYEEQLSHFLPTYHIAPHTTFVIAFWSVLTRLHAPKSDLYPEEIREIISSLTPVEKADLYARHIVPNRLENDQGRVLLNLVEELQNETAAVGAYEGRFGASPREMKVLLLSASQRNSNFISPIAIFEELEKLVEETSVYPFLQMKAAGLYHQHKEFITQVSEQYLERIDSEVRSAMGLIDEEQYDRLFERYVLHVSHQKRGEKVYDDRAKKHIDVDEKWMVEVEGYFLREIDDRSLFRDDLIATIAAWSIEFPDRKIVYEDIFPQLFKSMHSFFFEGRKKVIKKRLMHAIALRDTRTEQLTENEKASAREIVDYLIETHGYIEESAFEVVGYLFSKRYREL